MNEREMIQGAKNWIANAKRAIAVGQNQRAAKYLEQASALLHRVRSVTNNQSLMDLVDCLENEAEALWKILDID